MIDNLDELVQKMMAQNGLTAEDLDELEDAEDANIIWGQYEGKQAHDIMMWIKHIKAAQTSIIKLLDDLDIPPTKRILDASWHRLAELKRTAAEEEEDARFEKQYMDELRHGGYRPNEI